MKPFQLESEVIDSEEAQRKERRHVTDWTELDPLTTIHVLSLGGGVQSSTLAKMAALGHYGAKHVVVWIGISLDEAHRQKLSRVGWAVHRWPLIEQSMRRDDCLRWMKANGFPRPPRSACVFCPYHSDREWQRLKDEEPAEFARAVAFEKAYQAAKATTVSSKGFRPFLHRSRKPLDEVDFDGSKADWLQDQLLGMGQECEGICGV